MRCPNCGCSFMGMICPNCNSNPSNFIPPPSHTRPFTAASTTEKPKRSHKGLIAAVCLLGIAGIALGTIYSIHKFITMNQPQKSTPAAVREQTTISAEEQKKIQIENGVFEDGDYKVGIDIPEGIYLLSCNNDRIPFGIYSQPYNESNSESNELWFEWLGNNQYIKLENGQYIHFSWATLYDVSKHPDMKRDPFTEDGMFLVGHDILPGTYTLQCQKDISLAHYYTANAPLGTNCFQQQPKGLKQEETVSLKLEEGQIVNLEDCCFKSADQANVLVYEAPSSGNSYLVGGQVPEGLYVIYSTIGEIEAMARADGVEQTEDYSEEIYQTFYIQLSENGKYLLDSWYNNNYYVDLKKGQHISYSHAKMVPAEVYLGTRNPFSESGMYLVGEEYGLPPGEYEIKQNTIDHGYYRHFDTIPTDATEPLETGFVEKGTVKVKLNAGDCIIMDYCNLVKK